MFLDKAACKITVHAISIKLHYNYWLHYFKPYLYDLNNVGMFGIYHGKGHGFVCSI